MPKTKDETTIQNDCIHDWKEVESQFSNEISIDVKCIKCGMVGEKNIETGEVYFPAT